MIVITGTPLSIAPRFTALPTHGVFYKLKFVATLKVCQRHFSDSSCSPRVSVSHFGNSHSTPNFFIIIFVTVLCEQQPLMLLWWLFLWHYKPQPHKTANLFDKYRVCSHCSTNQLFSHLSLSPWCPYSQRHGDIEIGPANNLIMASTCSSERKSHISLTLNQKPKIINISEEDMLKAKTGGKLGLLHRTLS